MKKILACVLIAILTLMVVGSSVYAVDINDPTVFIKQSQSDWCTWASVAMMMRRQAILDGNANWSSITDASIHYSGGLRNDFTSCGYHIFGKFFSSYTNDNKSFLISMLKEHPEGIVCYMFSSDESLTTHAVLVTDYNASEDVFYCADPYRTKAGKRIKITEAVLTGGTSDKIVSNFKKFWYIDNGSCNLTESLVTPPPTTTTTYYTITLMGNGGTPSTNKVNSTSGSTISLPVPSAPTGYIFNGWFTAESGGSFVTGGTYKVSGNITLYAQWRPVTYNVTYNANGGSGAPAAQSKDHGETIKLSNTIPKRDGYSFVGWSLSETSSVGNYNPGDSFSNNANTTLYAVWKALPPSIRASKTSVYLDYDTNKSETITFTLEGQLPSSYHMYANYNTAYSVQWGGWNGTQTTLTITATEQEITNNRMIITLRDDNENVYASIDIYVTSAGRYCTITFDANGGTNAPSAQKVPYDFYGDASRLTKAKPQRSGYTFLGWSTNSSDTIPEYCDEENMMQITSDLKLYAIWHKTKFSIVINRNMNGGSGASSTVTLDIDLNNYKISDKFG